MTSNLSQTAIATLKKDLFRHIETYIENQNWPKSTLYVVATPIGNLSDLGLRAWYALTHADLIAAEDTRTSRVLFEKWGISTPVISAHQHNENSAARDICLRLGEGQRVALVSDAGSPSICDPGARVVKLVQEAGHRIIPIPGPSAVTTALMSSGVVNNSDPSYIFVGFVPSKTSLRLQWLSSWTNFSIPIVLFETPHRIVKTVNDIIDIYGETRNLTIARELTKRFEEIISAPVKTLPNWLGQTSRRCRGEFTIVIHPPSASKSFEQEVDADTDFLLKKLLKTVSVRDTVQILTRVTGRSRGYLYQRALLHRTQEI